MKSLQLKTIIQWIGLIAGPALALLLYGLLPHAYPNSAGETVEFSNAGRATTALAVWMAVWWMTEAVELYATALLPLVALPMTGAASMRAAAAPYAHELIFLFMGGFLIALAMQRWGLHRRLALRALRAAGDHPAGIVACFMGVTAFFSMWVSNTATAVMMLPIALSIISPGGAGGARKRRRRKRERRTGNRQRGKRQPVNAGSGTKTRPHFALCLLLGIAYAASIGGIGTIIGTPPNVFLASYIHSNLGQEISFVRWMGVGLPLVAVFLPLAWLMLTRVLYPLRGERIEGSRAVTERAYRVLGAMSRGERIVLAVFLLAALSWITRPLLVNVQFGDMHPLAGLSDPVIAMVAALILFVVPVDVKRRVFVMNWETALKLPWGILLLFGGGLSLAAAIQGQRCGGVHRTPAGDPVRHPSIAACHGRHRAGDLPHGTDQQHRHHGHVHPHPGCPGAGIRPSPLHADRTGRHCRQLRLHAAGRHAAQRHRLRVRPRHHTADDPSRALAEPGRRRPDNHPRVYCR